MNKRIDYYGKRFEIPHIKRETKVPINKNNLDKKLYVDFNRNLEEILDSAKLNTNKVDKDHIKDWLELNNFDIDPELFIPLNMFTNSFNKYHGYKTNTFERYKIYKEKTPKLSEIIDKKIAHSSEVSALAQIYLQDINIDSSYFLGNAKLNKESKKSSKHTYNLIDFNGESYIYDAINPVIKINNTHNKEKLILPRIQKVNNFKDNINKNKKYLIKSEGLIDNKEIFYG